MTKKEALDGLQRIREQVYAYKDDGILQIDKLYDEYGEFLIKEVLQFKSRDEFKEGIIKTADEFLKEVDEIEKQIKAGELDKVLEKE